MVSVLLVGEQQHCGTWGAHVAHEWLIVGCYGAWVLLSLSTLHSFVTSSPVSLMSHNTSLLSLSLF